RAARALKYEQNEKLGRLYGGDRATFRRAVARARRRRAEPRDQLGTELVGIDDRIDDQLRREPVDVDVLPVLLALLLDELLTLILGKLRDLLGIDRVDGRLWA